LAILRARARARAPAAAAPDSPPCDAPAARSQRQSVEDAGRLVSSWIQGLSDEELDKLLAVYRRKVHQERANE
jgi:hypothetical protein